MSSVVISGDTSGAITLAAATVAGTNTITLPAATGTAMVSGNMPAFSAYNNTTQTISLNTFVKVSVPLENFDTNNNLSSSTFTPTIAGYYQISGAVYGNGTNRLIVSLFKNGSEFFRGFDGGGTCYSGMVSGLIYCNGSTDYVELYVQSGSSTTIGFSGASNLNWFTGALVRAA